MEEYYDTVSVGKLLLDSGFGVQSTLESLVVETRE